MHKGPILSLQFRCTIHNASFKEELYCLLLEEEVARIQYWKSVKFFMEFLCNCFVYFPSFVIKLLVSISLFMTYRSSNLQAPMTFFKLIKGKKLSYMFGLKARRINHFDEIYMVEDN